MNWIIVHILGNLQKKHAIYYSLIAEQSDVVIGTREEYDMMENVENGKNEVTVQNLFKHSPELLVIKHGVDGSYAYTKIR